MKSSIFLNCFWLLALRGDVARAYWRMACSVSQTSRTDPILSPGTVSGHVHKFAGGNNINQDSTQDSLLTSTCSTCEIQDDKSAYWTPQLYYAHSNGTVEEVQNDGMTVYYVGRGGDSSNTVAFPPGFRMLSGNSLQRSYNSSFLTYQDTRPIADRVSFRCINEANDIPEEHYMFNTNCVNGMRAQINFQSCWDGQNLYLPYSAHVAYVSGIDYGSCPPSHPVPIPGLFFEVLYWTNRVDQSAGGQFVFSNGDATGYGFHGDFLNGWNQDVQESAVRDCLYTDNGGVISACPVLAVSDDVDFSRNCPESPAVWDEPVHGFLNSLPGCNPISSGPGLAPQVICPLNSNTPTQSEAASLASTTATATSSTSATDTTTMSTSTLSTDSTSSSESTSTSTSATSISQPTFTLNEFIPQSTPAPGVFATVATNLTTDSFSTSSSTSSVNSTSPTSFPTNLSFTTIYVTATATAAPTADIVVAAASTTFVTVTQPVTVTTVVAADSTTPTNNPAGVGGFGFDFRGFGFRHRNRRIRRQTEESESEDGEGGGQQESEDVNAEEEGEMSKGQAMDLSRLIAEVGAIKAETDEAGEGEGQGKGKEEEDDDDDGGEDKELKDESEEEAEHEDEDEDEEDEEEDEDEGDKTYHGSGMACMLWARC